MFNRFNPAPGDFFRSITGQTISTVVATSIMQSAGAGFQWAVTKASVTSVVSAVDAVVAILAGGSNTPVWRVKATEYFDPPLMMPEASPIYFQINSTGQNVFFGIEGFKVRV